MFCFLQEPLDTELIQRTVKWLKFWRKTWSLTDSNFLLSKYIRSFTSILTYILSWSLSNMSLQLLDKNVWMKTISLLNKFEWVCLCFIICNYCNVAVFQDILSYLLVLHTLEIISNISENAIGASYFNSVFVFTLDFLF